MEVQYIQECQCGAISVTFPNGAFNTMTKATFEKQNITGEHLPEKFLHCNHCINHWGIDLCSCGSGQPLGECQCGSKQASDKLGEIRKFTGWKF